VQGISTESEPSARDIANLIAQIRREGIQAVFVENMTSPRLAEMLARETGARLGPKVYSDSLSPPDGPAPTYLAMLRHNTSAFAAAMAAKA
jgi:zinc/manganese transport system substrate-binding protein